MKNTIEIQLITIHNLTEKTLIQENLDETITTTVKQILGEDPNSKYAQ